MILYNKQLKRTITGDTNANKSCIESLKDYFHDTLEKYERQACVVCSVLSPSTVSPHTKFIMPNFTVTLTINNQKFSLKLFVFSFFWNERESLTWVMSCMFQCDVIEMHIHLLHIQIPPFRTTTFQNPESHFCKVTSKFACSFWSPDEII